MSALRFISLGFVLLITAPCNAQAPANAGEYLNFIGEQYQATTKATMSFVSAVNHGKSARKVDKRRVELLQQVKQSESNVRRMKPYQKDSRLRDSVAAYFRLSYHVLSEDYGKILNMEDIAEQSYDLMEAYLLAKEKASQKLDAAGISVDKEYHAFAAANNIRLLENDSKLGQKMEAAGKVNDYYNKVYLIFFKSFKDEVYLMDAVNKGDVSAMEQSINALATSSSEGLAKLGPIHPFNGDGSLKAACQQLLTFYKKATVSHYPVYVEFQLKKDNFEKMTKAMEAKREKTIEDTDTYTKAVNDYNQWVTKVNKTNSERNKNMTQLLNTWNARTDDFLDRHTPKY